jgi:hypothetical protein
MSQGLSTLIRGLGLSPSVTAFLEDIQRNVRELRGIGVSNPDQLLVSRADLVSFGIAEKAENGGVVGMPSQSDAFDSTPPAPPNNLVVTGGYSQVFLKWAAPVDSLRGYFEVYSNSVDDVSTAVKIGQTTAWLFSDDLQSSSTKYYWVRSVSRFDDAIKSSFNQAAGTIGVTAPNLDYVLNVMTGANPDQPFYFLSSPTTIGGVLVPSGVYMKSIYALSATVSLFRAGLAVIDTANIIELNASKINAGEMSADRIETNSLSGKLATFTTGQFGTIFAGKAFLTSAMINSHLQSDNFNGNPATNDPGSAGWYIGRDGKLFGTGVLVSGTINASNFVGGTFNGGVFTGGLFRGSVNTLYTPPQPVGSNVRGGGVPYSLPNVYIQADAGPLDIAFSVAGGKFRIYGDGTGFGDAFKATSVNVSSDFTINAPGGQFILEWIEPAVPPPPIPEFGD